MILLIFSTLLQEIVESKSIYIVSFDRPGYGESDPHPTRTVKSLAFDIEELVDKLGLGSKIYIVGYSMGGQIVWSCLKYIPHRYVSFTLHLWRFRNAILFCPLIAELYVFISVLFITACYLCFSL